MPDSSSDRDVFERVIRSLEADVANIGVHLTLDANARRVYVQQIRAMADDLRQQAASGKISWAQAASEAQAARNAVMDVVRSRSTAVGRAFAQSLKAQGRTLNELIARQTVRMFGEAAVFERLALPAQNAVYAEIVKSAARANPQVNAAMQRLSRAGRGLLLLSVAASVYAVATADDKAAAAAREATVTGAGIGGGMAGGAIAGLACGPGSPVCVAVGAFVGGALGAFGMDLFW